MYSSKKILLTQIPTIAWKFSLLRNKWFLATWLVISLLGGVLGFVISEREEDRLSNSELIELEDYYNPNREYISGIEDTMLKNEYIRFEKDTLYPKEVPIEISTIKTDETLQQCL